MKILFRFCFIQLIIISMMATTYASSFTDVPADNWAYAAVTKLSKDGLIDGYGDGTFRGNKPMSRYEFAILVSKAMDRYDSATQKNQNLIDELSAEFASELNRLGTRVAKVETKTNTWIGGETRFRVISDNPASSNVKSLRGSDKFDFRQRIKFWGTISDTVSWTGRIATATSNRFGNQDYTPGSEIALDIANVTIKNSLGFDSIKVGRSAWDSVGNGLMSKAMNADGLLLQSHFGDIKFKAYTGNIGKNTNAGTGIGDSGNAQQVSTGQIGYKINKDLDIALGYYWADINGSSNAAGTGTLNTNVGSFSKSKGYDLSLVYKLGDYTILGDYINTTLIDAVGLPDRAKGFGIELSNRKTAPVIYPAIPLVNPQKEGSSAWLIGYRSLDAGTVPANGGGYDVTGVAYGTMPYNVFLHGTDNVNVLYLAYNNVLTKGCVFALEYQDFRIKNKSLTNLSSENLNKTFMAKVEFFY